MKLSIIFSTEEILSHNLLEKDIPTLLLWWRWNIKFTFTKTEWKSCNKLSRSSFLCRAFNVDCYSLKIQCFALVWLYLMERNARFMRRCEWKLIWWKFASRLHLNLTFPFDKNSRKLTTFNCCSLRKYLRKVENLSRF